MSKTATKPRPSGKIKAPPTINSVVMVQYSTETSSVSAKLEETSAELNAKNNSDGAIARVKTFETSNTPIGEIKALIARTSKSIKNHCLPCPQLSGMFYVKAKDVPTVQTIFDNAEAEMLALKKKVSDQWAALREHAETRMGEFKREVELPDQREFVDGFSMNLRWMAAPAPVAGTVLESLSDEVAARVKAESEKGIKTQLIDASAQPVRELIAMMADAVDKIPKAKRLRQERLDNLAKKIENIKELNWSNDDELDHLYKTLKATLNLDDAVSKDDDGRAEVVREIKKAKVTAEASLNSLGV